MVLVALGLAISKLRSTTKNKGPPIVKLMHGRERDQAGSWMQFKRMKKKYEGDFFDGNEDDEHHTENEFYKEAERIDSEDKSFSEKYDDVLHGFDNSDDEESSKDRNKEYE